MRKLFVLILGISLLHSCNKNDTKETAENIQKTINISLERFDVKFLNINSENLPQLKSEYPFLFPSQFQDTFWLQKVKNKDFISLNQEVKKVFPETSNLEDKIEYLISRVKHFFPKEKTPRVIGLVNEVILDKKAMYTNDFIFLSLDCYLGKNNRMYNGISDYQRQNLEPSQILPDLVTSFGYRKTVPSNDKSLISEMVYFGKIHYLKDVLLPEAKDFEKIGYTEQQYKWCVENEAQIWSYLIENNLLYDNNLKTYQRFMEEAPFTKFGLEIDADSPGKIGQWIGWQIVRSYMENNEISLEELMKKDATELFNKSKYKPKKK